MQDPKDSFNGDLSNDKTDRISKSPDDILDSNGDVIDDDHDDVAFTKTAEHVLKDSSDEDWIDAEPTASEIEEEEEEEDEEDDWIVKPETEKIPEGPLLELEEMIDDPVRMYLREMG